MNYLKAHDKEAYEKVEMAPAFKEFAKEAREARRAHERKHR